MIAAFDQDSMPRHRLRRHKTPLRRSVAASAGMDDKTAAGRNGRGSGLVAPAPAPLPPSPYPPVPPPPHSPPLPSPPSPPPPHQKKAGTTPPLPRARVCGPGLACVATPCGRVERRCRAAVCDVPRGGGREGDAGVRVGHVAGAPGRVGAACGGGVGGRRRRAAGGVRRRRAAGACCAGVRQSLQRV